MKQQQPLPYMAKPIFIYSLLAGNVTPLTMDYETISFIDCTSNGMFLSLNLSTLELRQIRVRQHYTM